MNNIFDKMTNQMLETLESGSSLALHNKNQEIDMLHLIWSLVTNTNFILNRVLNKLNIDK